MHSLLTYPRSPRHDDSAEGAQFRNRARAWLDAFAAQREQPQWRAEPDLEAEVARGRATQRSLYDGGLAGLTVPTGYGGAGLGVEEELIWAEESADAALPLGYLMLGLHLCVPTILAVGSEELKQRTVRAALRGDHVWCQLFSEPGAGSDLGGVSTRARLDGDHWVVSGQKVWTSMAAQADFGMLLVRTGEPEQRHRGLTMLILDMTSPGVEVRPLRQITGAAEFNEVFLDEVRVPCSNVLGQPGRGWDAVLAMLMNERVAVSGSDGMASLELDPLVELARASGAAQDPNFRDRFADLYADVAVIGLLADRVRVRLRESSVPGPEGSIGKLLLSQTLRRRADLIIEAGGPGAVAWPADRPDAGQWANAYLSAPASALGGGTDQVQRNILGERVLGLPREPVPVQHTHDGAGKR